MRLYLAHPFDCRKWVREWELDFEELDGNLELINPFYDNPDRDMAIIDCGEVARYDCDYHEIVDGDLDLIQSCDGVVAIVAADVVSYGTIMEIVYGGMYDKPVYLIVLNGHEAHPWFKYHASKIFTSLKEFVFWYEAHK